MLLKMLIDGIGASLKRGLLLNAEQDKFDNVMNVLGSFQNNDEFITLKIPKRHVHLLKVCESFGIRNSAELLNSFRTVNPPRSKMDVGS